MNIRLFKPSLGDDELNEIKAAFGRSWIGLGPNVQKFEREWSNFVNAEISLGLNSATAALHLALTAFNFEERKEVLVTTLTFAASATAILYNNLTPVLLTLIPKHYKCLLKI